MYSLLFLGSVSFVLSLFLTPLVRAVFRRFGLAHRGSETHHPIPRVGGIAIVISYVVSYLCLLALPLKGGVVVWDSMNFTLALMPAAGLIFLIGVAMTLLAWSRGTSFWVRSLPQVWHIGVASTSKDLAGI